MAKIFEHARPDCEECVRLDIKGVVFWDEYRSALDQLVQSDEADPNYPECLSAMKAAERQVIAGGKEWKAHQLTHRPVKSNAECASSGRNLRSRRAALD